MIQIPVCGCVRKTIFLDLYIYIYSEKHAIKFPFFFYNVKPQTHILIKVP
jgi:hypothetical protein